MTVPGIFSLLHANARRPLAPQEFRRFQIFVGDYEPRRSRRDRRAASRRNLDRASLIVSRVHSITALSNLIDQLLTARDDLALFLAGSFDTGTYAVVQRQQVPADDPTWLFDLGIALGEFTQPFATRADHGAYALPTLPVVRTSRPLALVQRRCGVSCLHRHLSCDSHWRFPVIRCRHSSSPPVHVAAHGGHRHLQATRRRSERGRAVHSLPWPADECDSG